MDRILFNYGLADITPAEPLLLAGFANRRGLSSFVHRPLTSRCLLLANNEKYVCLIVNDLMDVDPVIIRKITSGISKKTGLSDDSIIIASIHTHSAPVMEYGWSEANDRFIETVISVISDAASYTINDKQELRQGNIKLGSATCGINIARRDIIPENGGMSYRIGDPEGLRDEEVLVMEITDDSGDRKVTLFNYACHPVTLGYESNCISTDFPGRARELVEMERGGMAVFVNGATGDLNPREDNNTDPETTDREGEKLGKAVISAILSDVDIKGEFRYFADTIPIPYRDRGITREHILNEVRRKASDITEFFNWNEMLERWGEKVTAMIDRHEVGDSFPFRVNFIRVGKVVFFFTQGELFVRYQVELKKMFRGTVIFCITYAHGTGAYIPTADVFEKKGYEADQAYIYEILPSPLSPEIEKIYLRAAAGGIRSVLEG